MPNTLGLYDPLFYAQEALLNLEKALGMAGTIHRGYDKSPQQKGSTIQIRRPSTFTAQDAPSTAQDLDPGQVTITLNNWREVKFKLTDKELTFTTDVIVREHIRPAAYALADDIDSKLAALYLDVPYRTDVGATPALADISAGKKVLWDNEVPLTADDMFLMIDGNLQSAFESSAEFAQWQGAGEQGVQTQVRGGLGRKLNFQIFANQNVKTHVSGTVLSAGTDVVGAVNGAHAKGATTLAINNLSLTETILTGDSFSIAGITKRFVATADLTLSAGAGSLLISPALPSALSGGEVVTFDDGNVAGVHADNFHANLMYHRNAFALAMAPLSEMGNNIGARIASIADPKTGLALRSRLYYMPDVSEVNVALDVLDGIKTLDERMACRLRGDV